jgi:hypothetical protein
MHCTEVSRRYKAQIIQTDTLSPQRSVYYDSVLLDVAICLTCTSFGEICCLHLTGKKIYFGDEATNFSETLICDYHNMTSNKTITLTLKSNLKCLDSLRRLFYEEGLKIISACVSQSAVLFALQQYMSIQLRLT